MIKAGPARNPSMNDSQVYESDMNSVSNPAEEVHPAQVKPRKILVVDDQEEIRKLIRLVLENKGFDIVDADNSPSALAMLESEKPDLILLDQHMPEISGLGFMKMVKKNGNFRHFSVVMLSGDTSQALAVQGFREGVDDFVSKPFDPDYLYVVICRTLERLEAKEQKSREMELNLRLKAIEIDNKLKDEFLAVMSHELRTPLTSVIGFANRIPKKIEQNRLEKAITYSETISGCAKHLSSLLDDLLDYAKIESGRMSLNIQEVNLRDLARSVLTQYSDLMSKKRIRHELQFNGNSPVVKGDSVRLTQVITNLVSNSIKFTPRGGKITITMSLGSSKPASGGRFKTSQLIYDPIFHFHLLFRQPYLSACSFSL